MLTETAQGLHVPSPLPADQPAIARMVLSTGLAVEADIDSDPVPDDLLPRAAATRTTLR